MNYGMNKSGSYESHVRGLVWIWKNPLEKKKIIMKRT